MNPYDAEGVAKHLLDALVMREQTKRVRHHTLERYNTREPLFFHIPFRLTFHRDLPSLFLPLIANFLVLMLHLAHFSLIFFALSNIQLRVEIHLRAVGGPHHERLARGSPREKAGSEQLRRRSARRGVEAGPFSLAVVLRAVRAPLTGKHQEKESNVKELFG